MVANTLRTNLPRNQTKVANENFENGQEPKGPILRESSLKLFHYFLLRFKSFVSNTSSVIGERGEMVNDKSGEI